MKRRILVVEDDPTLALGLCETLASGPYEVAECRRGDAALARLAGERFDLVLLDIMLPGKSGYDVLAELRAGGAATPVILVSAKGREIDRVLGLRLGADDYVTKPFGVQELLARVEAVLRRSTPPAAAAPADADAEIRFGTVRVRPAALCGERASEPFALTPRELQVLRVLDRERGRAVPRERLLEEVWGAGYEGTDRSLDQVILRLRQKIEEQPARPRHIRTVHHVGYRLDP